MSDWMAAIGLSGPGVVAGMAANDPASTWIARLEGILDDCSAPPTFVKAVRTPLCYPPRAGSDLNGDGA